MTARRGDERARGDAAGRDSGTGRTELAGYLFAGAIVAVWAWLYLRGLGGFPLQMWDESRYAVPARNMLTSGNWLDPQLQVNTHSESLETSVRLVKPPLVYWLQAVAMRWAGTTTFAARLPSALATLGTAALVYRIAARTFDRRAGLAGALVFLAVPQVLSGNHGGRAAVPDAVLLFFGSLFVWLTWRGRERPRLLVPAGVAAGLAVMTKGFAAGVFVIALCPLLVYAREAYLARWRWTLAGIASTLAVALPWHLYALWAHGLEFVSQYVVQSALSRVVGGAPSYYGDPVFPFMNYPYIRKFVIPPLRFDTPVFQVGIVLAVGLLAWRVRRDGRAAHAEEFVLLWWTVAVPLTFVLGGGNKAWYVMPMHVPGAALIGSVPAALYDAAVGSASGDPGGGRSRRDRLRSVLPDGGGRRLRSVLPGGRERRELAGTAVYVLCCVLVVLALPTAGTVSDWAEVDAEQKRIATGIAAETAPDEPVYVLDDVGRASLMTMPFYADRDYRRTTRSRVRTDGTIRYVIVPVDGIDRLGVAHRVLERGDESEVALVAVRERGEAQSG